MDDPLEGLKQWLRQVVRDEVRAVLAENAQGGEYLTTREAARLAKVVPATIRRWVSEGDLDCLNAGRVMRVRRADLDRLMSRQRSGQQPSPEVLAMRDFGVARR